MIGKIHTNAMFLREVHGTANAEDGTEYELATGVGNGLPIITSKKTNNKFTLTWQDLVELATAAGINNEQDAQNANTNHS